jgi:hypothetical protein
MKTGKPYEPVEQVTQPPLIRIYARKYGRKVANIAQVNLDAVLAAEDVGWAQDIRERSMPASAMVLR